ncbi:hypothetical protein ACWCQS_16160 [Streptomyces sp. NPDC002076]
MAAPSHRRSLRKRRTLAVSAAVVAAGVDAGVFVMNANATAQDQDDHELEPTLTAGLTSAKNLPTELATSTGAGVLK